ncbi:MAG: hypothetical protein M1834_001532 [Cirrosporium novae-zelandiae]|nr:MAG: hypothetical protein M1834_004049 [Cirrosporium novae-zelandiae]KAI9735517.1 MAG: hypothetical protein M1834_001532 [Cirrosporium novae-zelandiae]
MVRVKHRYLLAQILYPEPPPPAKLESKTTTTTRVPDVVQFHQPTSDNLTPQALLRLIRSQISVLYGDYGAGAAGGSVVIKYLSPATSTVIIRCPRAHYRLVWAALSYITKLPDLSRKRGEERPCVIQVVRVSGTIRKAEEEATRRARAAVLKAKRDANNGANEQLEALLGNGRAKVAAQQDVTMSNVSDIEDDDEEDDYSDEED